MKLFNNDLGISENIGVILMVSVAVIGVAIVSVSVTSEPTPEEIPNADLIVGYEKIASNNFSINLFHNGGDTLIPSELDVQAWDEYDRRIDVPKSTSDQFAIGDILSFFCDKEPVRISVLYTGGSSTAMLKSLDLGSKIDADKLLDSVINDDGSSGDSGGSGGNSGNVSNGEETEFTQYLIDENIFIYGKKLDFHGGLISGPNAQVIITDSGLNGDLLHNDPDIDVTKLFVNGGLYFKDGSDSFGSPTTPGQTHINGDVTLLKGNHHFYGTTYVNGDFRVLDGSPNIHGNMYVNGDLHLAGDPNIGTNACIYYTGNFTFEDDILQTTTSKCIPRTTVSTVETPELEIPQVKSDAWYADRNYKRLGSLRDDLKIFADSYTSPDYSNVANNVIIIAKSGDISITGYNSGLTGVLIAPEGKVTYNGAYFTGVVITKNGFFTTNGGTTVTFKNIASFIGNSDDYPL